MIYSFIRVQSIVALWSEFYSVGLSTEVIDIFNSEDLENARQRHIENIYAICCAQCHCAGVS